MQDTKRLSLSPRGLVFASLVIPCAVLLGCYSAPADPSGAGGSSGAAGTTGAGGETTSGAGGTTTTGAGGDTSTGAGGTTTTGAGGDTSTGAGGTITTGAGGTTTGAGGATSTGAGGRATGAGGTTITGVAGTTGGGGRAGSAGGAAGGRGGSAGSAGLGGKGGAGGGGKAGTSGAAGRTGNLRVMLLGDSTTSSICYRSHLWQLLTNAGHTQFDFIGTRKGDPGCSFTAYDQDNEGHGGYIVTDILKATSTGRPSGADPTDLFDSSAKDLATWFDGHPADAVLMHFGTNDVWNNIAPATILNAYTAILTRLRTNNANVHMLVAEITPLNPSGCSACVSRVQALNALIPGWATSNSTTASPITVVDQYTNFNVATDTVDGVHATDAGSVKIATNWYNALVPLF